MGGMFSFVRDSVTPTAGSDLLTVIPATSRQFELIEASVGGMGTTSSANSVQIGRSQGGTTGGGALTPRPHREKQAAFAGTNFTTWAAQPTFLGDGLVLLPYNGNGGLYRWVRIPGDTIQFVDGDTDEQMSVRQKAGTAPVSMHVMVEEF